MKRIRFALLLSAMAFLSACTATSPQEKSIPEQENKSPESVVEIVPEGEEEKTSDEIELGMTFHSDALGITLEFPENWENLIQVYDEETSVRIDVFQGWETDDDHSGYVGSIFRFAKSDWENHTAAIPSVLYGNGGLYVMADNGEDVVVFWSVPSGGLVNYENENSPGYQEFKMVLEGLTDGQYDILF